MASRSFSSQGARHYPKINIDRNSVIKSCIAEQNASDQFIDRPAFSWSKYIHDIWQQGLPLKHLSNIEAPVNANKYYAHCIHFIKYLALMLLHIYSVYLHIYGYFYPYSLLSIEDVCKEFSRCRHQLQKPVIKAFAWHPTQDRCALAICNDYIYIYQGSTRIRVLRRNQQRNIVDLAWHPIDKEILVVATHTGIIIWRVTDAQNTGPVNSKDRPLNFLSTGIQLIRRDLDSKLNSFRAEKSYISETEANNLSPLNDRNFILVDNVLAPPIVSLTFNKDGTKIYACSPNSSKIAVLNITPDINSHSFDKDLRKSAIHYLVKYGHGITRLVWSPARNRLAVATTTSSFRVYEPFSWSCGTWLVDGLVQDMVWSGPTGRILLIAVKNSSCLYALPFLDEPQANDVGGNKSLMKVLDLSPRQCESGGLVGGAIHSLAWDKSGRRLAISFKDNSESILLFRTFERPTVEFHQLGMIQSDNGSSPLLMDFHDKFENGSLLSICWSDGNCQHIPLSYAANEINRIPIIRENDFDNSNDRFNHSRGTNSPQRTPRSLTNFCHVSGVDGPSAYPKPITPINKTQHQTTLYSLSESHLPQKDSSWLPNGE